MRRVVAYEANTLQLQSRPIPRLEDDEVLIRLRLGGICSTDLAVINGYHHYHGVLGHEFVGEVIEGNAEWRGKRVVGEINILRPPHYAPHLDRNHHKHRQVLGILGDYDGAFAEVFHLPIVNLHEVSPSIPDEVAVFTEPLAAACQILEQIHIAPTTTVYVLGAGKLGMLVAQVLKSNGIHVVCIIRYQHQANLLNRWGIETCYPDSIAANSADFLVDTTGSPTAFAEALRLVRPRGTIILKSTYNDLPPTDLSQIVVKEIRLVGSRCGPFAVALRYLAEERIDVQNLIDAEYSFDHALDAFAHAAQSGTLKVLLRP